MAATVNEASVKFIADLSTFSTGVGKAAEDLKRTLKPAIQDINKSFADLGKFGTKQLESITANAKLTQGFADLGKAASQPINQIVAISNSAKGRLKKDIGEISQAAVLLGNTVGGSFGAAVAEVGLLSSAARGVGATLAATLGPVGLFLTGAAAVSGALVVWKDRAIQASEANVKLEQSIKKLDAANAAQKSIAEGATAISSALKGAQEAIRQDPLFSEFDKAKASVEALEGAIGTLRGKLAEALSVEGASSNAATAINFQIRTLGNELVAARAKAEELKIPFQNFDSVDKAIESMLASLKRAQAEEELFGASVATTKAQLEAVSQAMVALKTAGDAGGSGVEKLRRLFDALNATLAKQEALVAPAAKPTASGSSRGKSKDVDTGTGPEAFVRQGTGQLVQKRLDEIYKSFSENGARISALQTDLVESGVATYTQLAQGIGDAVGRAIVYQEDLGAAAQEVLAQVAASVISTLIQLAAQQLLLAILGNATLSTTTGNKVAASAAVAGAAAYADAVLTQGIIGIGTGAGFATAAIAGTLAAAAAGGVAGQALGIGLVRPLAKGGIVTGPLNALVGEAGTEVVAPISDLRKFINPPGGQGNRIVVQVDRRTLAEWVVREMPAVLRLHGVKGL